MESPKLFPAITVRNFLQSIQETMIQIGHYISYYFDNIAKLANLKMHFIRQIKRDYGSLYSTCVYTANNFAQISLQIWG